MTYEGLKAFLKEYYETMNFEDSLRLLRKYGNTEYCPILKALLVGEIGWVAGADMTWEEIKKIMKDEKEKEILLDQIKKIMKDEKEKEILLDQINKIKAIAEAVKMLKECGDRKHYHILKTLLINEIDTIK